VYISQESGVIGLNFHQSKEVLISDSTNGSTYGVSCYKSLINAFILIFAIFQLNGSTPALPAAQNQSSIECDDCGVDCCNVIIMQIPIAIDILLIY
jgi:hypothetical protein